MSSSKSMGRWHPPEQAIELPPVWRGLLCVVTSQGFAGVDVRRIVFLRQESRRTPPCRQDIPQILSAWLFLCLAAILRCHAQMSILQSTPIDAVVLGLLRLMR